MTGVKMVIGMHILTVTIEPCVNESGELRIHVMQNGNDYYAACSYEPGCQEWDQYGEKTVTWTSAVAAGLVSQVCDALRNTAIPALPVFYAGHDGLVYEVSLGDYMGAATYRWWGTPPQGWEMLGRVHRNIVDSIEIPRLEQQS